MNLLIKSIPGGKTHKLKKTKSNVRTKTDESKLSSSIRFFFFEKAYHFWERYTINILMSYISHVQNIFVPKYDYFFLSEIKLEFTAKKAYINFRINFQSYITKISSLKHNYFLMLQI